MGSLPFVLCQHSLQDSFTLHSDLSLWLIVCFGRRSLLSVVVGEVKGFLKISLVTSSALPSHWTAFGDSSFFSVLYFVIPLPSLSCEDFENKRVCVCGWTYFHNILAELESQHIVGTQGYLQQMQSSPQQIQVCFVIQDNFYCAKSCCF